MREMMQWQVHFLCLWLCASLPHYLILFCGAQFSIAVRRSFGLSHMLYQIIIPGSGLFVRMLTINLRYLELHMLFQSRVHRTGSKSQGGLWHVLKTVSEKIGLNSDSMAEVDLRPSMQRRPRCGSGTRVSSHSHSFK